MGIECRPGEVETVDHAQKRMKAAGVGVFGNVVEGSMRGLQADSNLCGGDARHRVAWAG